MREYEKIKLAIIRGGTSKGVYLMDNELPTNSKARDRVILSIFGSPDSRQIDGLGGADPLTSKVAIIKRSTRDGVDVDYTFGQVAIDRAFIDYNNNCGNISAGVGPFAIDEGWVHVSEPITKVRIFNTNTQNIIEAEVPVKNGRALVAGDFRIPGVQGTGAKIVLNFLNSGGSKTGKLLPTGNKIDTIFMSDGSSLRISIVDAANPAIFVKAKDIGLTGKELPDEINQNSSILIKLEEIRSVAAEMLGFVSIRSEATVKSPTIPKVVYVAEAEDYLTTEGVAVKAERCSFLARTMSMQKMHKAYAVTGGICTSTAALIPGTVVNEVYQYVKNSSRKIHLGHPSGVMEFTVELEYKKGGAVRLIQAAVARTARRILDGFAYVPSKIYWDNE
jgi:2-methylaconitate cis-trans-isomerase PrpF